MKGLTKAQKQKGIIPPRPKKCNGYFYTVSKGESLFIIAKKHKVTLNNLIEANPQIKDPDRIFEGQVICIPKFEEKVNGAFSIINLNPTPEATMAQGVAFVRKETDDLLVVASNLPSPELIFPNANTYTVFLLDESTGNVDKFNLALENELWVGQRVKKSLRPFNFIIIAPNIASGSLLPGEPIVLEANLEEGK